MQTQVNTPATAAESADSAVALPRAPVLDWVSFRKQPANGPGRIPPSVADLPHTAFTTSGRAAIYQALLQLQLPEQSTVLLPTYNCPTMAASVLQAGLRPVYFGLRSNGLPDLDSIKPDTMRSAKAMLVVHYFGFPRSLAEVRQWCDAHGIFMIEDCAHCYFGQAGDRPVGRWGDFTISSLSKFFPVPEAGLLGSAHRTIEPLALTRAGWRNQLKGCLQVLEFAVNHRRLTGLRPLLVPLLWLKNHRPKRPVGLVNPAQEKTAATRLRECDMNRVAQSPLWISLKLQKWLPRERIVARRRENYALYAEQLSNINGAKPLFHSTEGGAVPYAYPLWVDDADGVYVTLKTLKLPVFRWNELWPGTPSWADDAGCLWSRHVLQLLCHQDLTADEVTYTVQAIRRTLVRQG